MSLIARDNMTSLTNHRTFNNHVILRIGFNNSQCIRNKRTPYPRELDRLQNLPAHLQLANPKLIRDR